MSRRGEFEDEAAKHMVPRTGQIEGPDVSMHVSQIAPGHYYIRNLAVKSGKRGQGIGTRFIQSLGQEYGSHKLTLHAARPEMVEYYKRFGFEPESEELGATRMTRHPR